jgi:hypothetical protein
VLREDAEIRGWLTVEALEEIRRVIGVAGKPPRRTSVSVQLPLNHEYKRILGLANQGRRGLEPNRSCPITFWLELSATDRRLPHSYSDDLESISIDCGAENRSGLKASNVSTDG